jgi:hypothetical protein
MNTGRIKPFDESRVLVRLREPEESSEETTFTADADEEPHFLKPDLGYGCLVSAVCIILTTIN